MREKKNIPEKKSGCADQNDPPHVAVIRGSKDMLLLAGEVGKMPPADRRQLLSADRETPTASPQRSSLSVNIRKD